MNLSPLGLLASSAVMYWAVSSMGLGGTLLNVHGLVVVIGGVFCAAMVNYPISQFVRAAGCLQELFFPPALPELEEVAAEIMRLGQLARARGGMLALQNEGRDFAGGFLNRTLLVAMAVREPARVREILDNDIKTARVGRQEDGNFFRTLGTLSPMFGLMGTLLGIILVLRNMSDPLKIGPAMSVAITASLYGIGFSNLVCVPLAGNVRMRAMRETRVREAIIDGVIELMRAESLYVLELTMGSYGGVAAPAGPPGGPAQ